MQRQQRNMNELTYQRRMRNLHQASLLTNLNETFPNAMDGSLTGFSSNSIVPRLSFGVQLSQVILTNIVLQMSIALIYV